MSDENQQADHTEDPRKQGTGTGGYPESTQDGTEGSDAGGPDGGDGGGEASPPATEEESDRERTTGNPNAAG